MSFMNKLADKLGDKLHTRDKSPTPEDHPVQQSYPAQVPPDGYAQYGQQPYDSFEGQHQTSYGQPPQYGGAPPSLTESELPVAWIKQWDTNSQRFYYVEQATGRSQWESPSSGVPPPSGTIGQYGQHADADPVYSQPGFSPSPGVSGQYGHTADAYPASSQAGHAAPPPVALDSHAQSVNTRGDSHAGDPIRTDDGAPEQYKSKKGMLKKGFGLFKGISSSGSHSASGSHKTHYTHHSSHGAVAEEGDDEDEDSDENSSVEEAEEDVEEAKEDLAEASDESDREEAEEELEEAEKERDETEDEDAEDSDDDEDDDDGDDE